MKFLYSDALFDTLVRQRVITDKQRQLVELEKGKQRHKLLKLHGTTDPLDKNFPDLVDIIVSLNLKKRGTRNEVVDEEAIAQAVSREFTLPFKKLDPLELDINIVTKTIPKNFAIRHLLVPFNVDEGVLEVASYHPDCEQVCKDIEQANQVKTRAYIATKAEIKRILAEFFGFQTSISAAEDQFGRETIGAVDIGNLERFVAINEKNLASTDQHIKNAVNHIFNYALDQRASDIHVEPKREFCVIRFRIDGTLHMIYQLPKVVHPAIISRLKYLSRLDIAEKRRPQDGRIKLGVSAEKEVEVRISTVPVSFGEKAVLRILDPDVIFQSVDQLGFSARDYQVFRSFITSPHGIVLVTGPTGSGKSTTLYSALKEIASPEMNLVTIEDPVEMVHEEFNQIAVQPLIDITFSSILRNILRQDPDVIMIGEIRDHETAAHAVQAAMTGHLVFSTLHTNDAVSSIVRLMDLDLEPFLISSTMLGAMAQRLVKRICVECAEVYEVDGESLRKVGFPVNGGQPVKLKRGKGCRECRGTGFRGRAGIFEIFPLSTQLKQMVADGKSVEDMRQVATREGMTTLREDAWNKVKTGVTTIEEALRVTST
jgi:general secretion pathway protein E